ncbi:MAG: H(+)-transporting ATPase [Clostridia bacterium]|nr:H(+)-transporting ATPase [Clostridia bacterium]
MKKIKFKPYTKLVLTLVIAMLVGAVLLMLPISQKDGVNLGFVDSLFMSCSAICVTGLSVVADITSSFTTFGLGVILVLIEIGGLGIITITVFFAVMIGAKIGITERFEIKEMLNQKSSSGMVKLILIIIATTVIMQVVFGFINFSILLASGMYSVGDSLLMGMFHSVSSFNNSGFDIFGSDISMLQMIANVPLTLSTIVSSVMGAIGFIVIYDIIQKVIHGKKHKIAYHTKVVFIMSFLICLFGTLALKICMGSEITWLEALFQSISSGNAGFEGYDMNRLNMSAYMIILGLMFIGSSPCSTGGGIKNTTLFVICVSLYNFARGRQVVVFNRKIDNQSVFKAFALFVISILYVFVALIIFINIESGLGFQECMFEVVSAFSTVGLSMGITPSLQLGSKLLLIVTMFIGRIGPLTIISVLNKNWNKSSETVGYVEEKMIIG